MKPTSPLSSAPALRDLPSVDYLLRQSAIASLLDEVSRPELLHVIHAVLEDCRNELRRGQAPALTVTALALRAREKLYERQRPHLRRVINATGIVLHTGLGRAPLAAEALAAAAEIGADYCNLEVDLSTGQRGDRHEHARELLTELTGAEDALVVNNNAAATYLTLHALACGRGAIVSRGQLVEIGGSYRMPDIMAAAGCRMVEVGSTNRTRRNDYERAIDEQTAILLRVHTSNYRIRGFVEHTPLAELAALAHERGLLAVDDLGGGLLDADLPGLTGADGWDEPSVRDSVAAGADVSLFSGDKLLGGPQAGIIIGRRELLRQIRANPLMRTFRPDKVTLAALEATLRLYRDPETVVQRVPALRLLTLREAELRGRAEAMARRLRDSAPAVDCRAEPDTSEAGGGSLPTVEFPTWVISVAVSGCSAVELAVALRSREIPVIGRIRAERAVLDCRTISPDDDELVVSTLAAIASEASASA